MYIKYLFLFLLNIYSSLSVQDNTLVENRNVKNKAVEYYPFLQGTEIHHKPKWLIIAGRKVIPGSIKRVAIQILPKDYHSENIPVDVKVSLLCNEQQISFAETTVQEGEQSSVLLQVPEESSFGKWQLKVEGFEGKLNTFRNFTDLSFTPEFLTILVHTSRPIYNAQQVVKFRSILLTKEFTPYNRPVDVYVLDPSKRIMRRWPSRQPADGVVSLEFGLPEFPELGDWTIQIRANLQVQNQTIKVHQYYKQRFEVFVRLPHTFTLGVESIEGVVVANMTNGRHVYGNCTVTLQLAANSENSVPDEFTDIYSEQINNFTGVYPFFLPTNALEGSAQFNSSHPLIIRVEAMVGDTFGGRVHNGWAMSRLHTDTVKISFLGEQPFFYQPTMPMTFHISVSYDDDHPLSEKELLESELHIAISSSELSAITVPGSSLAETKGIATITSVIPRATEQMEIVARYESVSGVTSSASTYGLPYFSPTNRNLIVQTSSTSIEPGEFIVLHVRNNFYAREINYAVLSEGLLVYNGQEPVFDLSYPTVTTFSLPASAEMAPVAKILVWVVDQEGELVTSSLAVPVDPISRHEVEVEWNYHKDHSGNSIELLMTGEMGAYFATQAVWEEVYLMNSGHNLDQTKLMNQIMRFSGTEYANPNHTVPHIRHKIVRHRDGSTPITLFYPTPNNGIDVPSTLDFNDAVLLTDARVRRAGGVNDCYRNQGLRCLSGGCFKISEKCDGIRNCPDSSDEFGCPIDTDKFRDFRLHRISPISYLYNEVEGDWAWSEVRGESHQVLVFEIPKRPQTWMFSLFAVGKETGLAIMDKNIQITCRRPFLMLVDTPKVARMWEQVSLTIGLFNFHTSPIGVLITIPKSSDYQVIVVGDKGVVESYNPDRLTGTFQHVIWLKPGASQDLNVPIVFNKQGTLSIVIEGATQMNRDSYTAEIEVIPEGVSIGQHTSILLDLKNRAIAYEFLDLILDESPIIPYSLDRRYIFSTPAGQISISGDVIGPMFPEIPVNSDNMMGFDVIGAETSAYNFAANAFSLHYLRLTNQLDDHTRFEVLTAINVDYASLSRYQDKHGAFSNWIGTEKSVWLTAHALKCLTTVNFQDWENYIYVDPVIMQRGTEWLLKYQTAIGSFTETPSFFDPLDPKIDPRIMAHENVHLRNISLTAKVLITLQTVIPSLQGNLHFQATLAKKRGIKYLEMMLPHITDPYELAVVAWALTRTESTEKEVAFSKLDAAKRTHGNLVYWSREKVIIDPRIYEDSQKAYLQPKEDNEWDSLTSEATSYALLVYVAREGIGILQENIVRSLNSMRTADGGILSTQDSLVALEALVEYSYRARLREVTDMTIVIEQSADPDNPIVVNLKNEPGLASMRAHELENFWGHISVTGRGSGQAIIQLDYSYGVDALEELDQPVVPAFELEVFTRYHGRNKSQITITSCQRWINTDEAQTSGLAVVEIHLPSGYSVVLQELLNIVNSGEVPNLRWARITNIDIKFFFKKLTPEPVCFSYNIDRWYPVSNHSRYNHARVYELYQPERFELKRYELFPLYALDICEVCGSFQCPYCPFYSGSSHLSKQYHLIWMSIMIILLHGR